MKKSFIVIISTVLFVMIFTSCGQPPVKDGLAGGTQSDLTATLTDLSVDLENNADYTDYTEENSTEEPTEINIENDPYGLDNTAIEILESIKNSDYKKVAEFMMATDVEAYRFIEDMTVESYEIVETKDLEYRYAYYKVKFNVSESNNDYFPVGESYWDLVLHANMELVSIFRTSAEEILNYLNFPYERSSNKENDFCYNFSHYLWIFETTTDFNMALGSLRFSQFYEHIYEHIDDYQWKIDMVHDIIHYYVSTATDNDWITPLYVNIVEDYMMKTAGITGVDYRKSAYYMHSDEIAEDYIDCGGHGGWWRYWLPISKEYDETSKIYTVVIDYFADTALLVVAKTMKYTLTENDDGTYKMLSTELLYDSGYGIAGGGV